MKRTEARKRVARALVRKFFRQLYNIIELENLDITGSEQKGDENDMANGIIRCDKDHSNISTPSPKENNTICDEKIKREKKEMNADGEARETKGKT